MKLKFSVMMLVCLVAVTCELLEGDTPTEVESQHRMQNFQNSLFNIFERMASTINRNETVTEDKTGNVYILNIVKNLSLHVPPKAESSPEKEVEANSSTISTPGISPNITELLERINQLETAKNTLQLTQQSMENEIRGLRANISAVSANTGIRVIESCNMATTSGLYKLKAVNRAVHCEMTSFGGRWLVIQHRKKFDVDFNRNWQAYRNGFGSVGMDDDFWLGLEAVYQITNDGHSYELMMELKHELQYGYARYSSFRIAGEADHYRVSVSGFSGSIPDRFTHHNNMKFSTYDKDNDNWTGNCGLQWNSGWWYNQCHQSNLNKQIGTPTVVTFWSTWGHYLTYTRMMVRRK